VASEATCAPFSAAEAWAHRQSMNGMCTVHKQLDMGSARWPPASPALDTYIDSTQEEKQPHTSNPNNVDYRKNMDHVSPRV